MDIAYSIDMCDIIDAEKAYELFWSGKITNKQNFECPSENCSAQITCANIDKLEHNMKQGVHYRVQGNHVTGCEYDTKKDSSRQDAKFSSKENSYKDIQVDNFLLQRPEDYYDKKEVKNNNDLVVKKVHKKRLNASYNNGERPRNYYSIRSLVTNYNKCSNHSKFYVCIKSMKISYSDFFIDINQTYFNKIDDYPRVYFQKAFVNSLQNGNIQIRFAKGFKNDSGEIIPTSIFIDKSNLENEQNSYWRKKLLSVVNSKRSNSLVFIYGKPYKNGLYCNFRIKNMDFLEIRNNLP